MSESFCSRSSVAVTRQELKNPYQSPAPLKRRKPGKWGRIERFAANVHSERELSGFAQ